MPSKSKSQHNLMAMVAHDPKAAKRVGIPQSVGRDYIEADKGRKFGSGGSMKARPRKFAGGGVSSVGTYRPTMSAPMQAPARAPAPAPARAQAPMRPPTGGQMMPPRAVAPAPARAQAPMRPPTGGQMMPPRAAQPQINPQQMQQQAMSARSGIAGLGYMGGQMPQTGGQMRPPTQSDLSQMTGGQMQQFDQASAQQRIAMLQQQAMAAARGAGGGSHTIALAPMQAQMGKLPDIGGGSYTIALPPRTETAPAVSMPQTGGGMLPPGIVPPLSDRPSTTVIEGPGFSPYQPQTGGGMLPPPATPESNVPSMDKLQRPQFKKGGPVKKEMKAAGIFAKAGEKKLAAHERREAKGKEKDTPAIAKKEEAVLKRAKAPKDVMKYEREEHAEMGMKRGGGVKKYARGGGIEVRGKTKGTMIKMREGGSVSAASRRADGCAMRGKTKGRIY